MDTAFPAASATPVELTILRRIVCVPPPELVPVLMVTVRVVPLPVTEVMDGATEYVPVVVSVKLLIAPPVTVSENVTVKLTEDAVVGLALLRLMLLTVGAVLSMV